MTTLAEFMIIVGADNLPPMLEKSLYDSWKSKFYMENMENGRMILDSIQNGPLVWPTITEEDGTTRKKTYAERSASENLQVDYDCKATNIILQGLPPDVYAIVNYHKVSKEIWDRVKLLMQRTKLSLQEKECKLYDEFDKFTFLKGETLYQYYWRFAQLINNMNVINMSMRPVQVNTKFLNSLPPEWSKFVTDVKLVRDLHTTNYDQLYSYLEQHEMHANETRLMRERYQDPLAFVANYHQSPSQLNNYHSQYNSTQFPQQSYMVSQVHSPQPYSQMYPPHHPSQPQISHLSVPPSQQYQSHQTSYVPQIAYTSPQPSTQPLTEFPQMDSGLAVIVFNQGDDPISCINKAMSFLTVVTSSRFLSTNNQLRTSSNPRNQATIQDGGQVKVVKCYNCQGEGHMARKCTQPKRPRNAAWFKEKAMLAEAQEAGQFLDEEQLAFLVDLGIPDGQTTQTTIPNIAAFQTEDLDGYDSDCDDVSNAKVVLMANLSNDGSNCFEQTLVVDFTNNEITSDSNIIPYSQYLQETQQAAVQDTNLHAQQDSMILSVIEQMSKQMINHVNNWKKVNQEKKSLTAELKRYKKRVKTFEQRLNVDLSSREKMIDSQMDDMIKEKLALKEQVDSLEQNISKQIKEKESLLQTFTVFKNESKEKENKYMENEIDLVKKIKESDNIVYKVGQSAQAVHMLTKPRVFYDDTHKQALGYQNPFYLKKAQRIKPTLYDGSVISSQYVASPMFDDEDALILEELNRLSEDFGKLFVPQQELSDEQAFWLQTSHPNTDQSASSPVKIEAHQELPKEHIKTMREKDKEEKVKHNMDEIETINIELEHSVAKLLSENDRLHKEIEHLKKIYKDHFDSIKKTRALSKEHGDSLIAQLNSKSMENTDLKHQIQDKVFVITSLKNDLQKLKGKETVENVAQIPITTTIAPGMFNIALEPLAPRLLNNREAHIDYLKHTQEQADILQRIVEQAKAKQPLDNTLDFASRDTNLYTNSLDDMLNTSPICLISKASKNKSNINTVAAKPVALDNALVPPEKRLKIEKCNARIEFIRESRAQILCDMYSKKNANFVALLWEDFMFQADNKEISSARKEHMPYPRFTKVIINHLISKDKTISIRNKINLHTVCDDTLLATLKFVSKTQDYQQHGALIPDEMFNQDIKDSKAYKTYLDFATGKATPKKVRKFKKVASPSRKLSPILEEGPAVKPKRAKKPTKKFTTVPTSGVVIRDTPSESVPKKKTPAKVDRGKCMDLLSDLALLKAAQLKKTLKKSKLETHKLHASGSGDGVDSQPKVPDEQEDKTTGTYEGTNTKPRVPDVPKYLSCNTPKIRTTQRNTTWGATS
ncbi:retrovirus-related pol polyprotein from transposon TNT 1-94 [Tanacetum coccineum]